MTVRDLKDMLNLIDDDTAEIMLIHNGDSFYDGRKITGVMIMQHLTTSEKEADLCRVFIEEE